MAEKLGIPCHIFFSERSFTLSPRPACTFCLTQQQRSNISLISGIIAAWPLMRRHCVRSELVDITPALREWRPSHTSQLSLHTADRLTALSAAMPMSVVCAAMPWSPTRAFPSPLARFEHTADPGPLVGVGRPSAKLAAGLYRKLSRHIQRRNLAGFVHFSRSFSTCLPINAAGLRHVKHTCGSDVARICLAACHRSQ